MKARNIFLGLFILSLWGCNASTDSSTTSSSLFTSSKVDGIVYSLTVERTEFDLLDALTGTFQVYNESGEEREFHFSCAQQLGFELFDMHGTTALLYPVITNPSGSILTLRDGERKVYTICSAFRDNMGECITHGRYELHAHLLIANSPHVSLAIEVR